MPSINDTKVLRACETARQTQVTDALSAIDRIRSAGDAAECLELLHAATRAIGATASLYIVAIPEAGPELSSIALFACDPGFARQAFDFTPMETHPWVRFARAHTTPGTAGQVQIDSATDAAAVELARSFGFVSCLIVPTIAAAERGRVELLCVGKAREDGFEGEDQHIVRLLARALAAEMRDWFTTHLRASLQRATRLQAVDVQLLTFEREGLSSKEIAQRTGMSIAAVDSRFQRLNRRLNCASRKASARRAAEHGMLEVVLPTPACALAMSVRN